MKNLIWFALLVFVFGCEHDPSNEDLSKGEGFKSENANGTIEALEVKHFSGDLKTTSYKKGNPYYCVRVADPNKGKDEYVGVPFEEFKVLYVGQTLPPNTFLTLEQFGHLKGKVVDKFAYPDQNRFFVVVDDTLAVNVYRIDKETYYRRVDISMSLPIVK